MASTKPARSCRPALALAAVAMLAVGVRIAAIPRAQSISRDGTAYISMARELQQTPLAEVARVYDYPPGYPAMIGMVGAALRANSPEQWALAGQCVAAAMSLLALAAIYLLATEAFDRQAAIITVAMLAISPSFTSISCDVLSDPPAVAMTICGLILGLRAAKRLRTGGPDAAALSAGAGLSAGLGYTIRPEALVALVITAAMLAFPGLVIGPKSERIPADSATDDGRRATRRYRVRKAVCLSALLLAAAICVLPYATLIGGLTYKKSLHDFIASPAPAGAHATLAVISPDASLPLRILDAARRVADRTRASAGTVPALLAGLWFATLIGKKVLRLPLPKSTLLHPSRAGWMIMFASAILMLPLVMGLEVNRGPAYITNRHTLLPALLLATAAGAGVQTLAQWVVVLSCGKLAPYRHGLISACLTLCVLATMMFFAFPVLHEGKGVYRQAGQLVRKRFGPDNLVFAQDARVAFYAGAPAEQFRTRSNMPWSLPEDLAAISDALRQRRFVCPLQNRYRLVVLSPDAPADDVKDQIDAIARSRSALAQSTSPAQLVGGDRLVLVDHFMTLSNRKQAGRGVWIFLMP